MQKRKQHFVLMYKNTYAKHYPSVERWENPVRRNLQRTYFTTKATRFLHKLSTILKFLNYAVKREPVYVRSAAPIILVTGLACKSKNMSSWGPQCWKFASNGSYSLFWFCYSSKPESLLKNLINMNLELYWIQV